MTLFFHKFKKEKNEKVLAACDKDVLGNEFSEKGITLQVRENFYGEEEVSQEELLEKASESTVINAVGNEVVKLLRKNGFFSKDRILEVEGVSHAQMVKI